MQIIGSDEYRYSAYQIIHYIFEPTFFFSLLCVNKEKLESRQRKREINAQFRGCKRFFGANFLPFTTFKQTNLHLKI